jgi:hypothetical protein
VANGESPADGRDRPCLSECVLLELFGEVHVVAVDAVFEHRTRATPLPFADADLVGSA